MGDRLQKKLQRDSTCFIAVDLSLEDGKISLQSLEQLAVAKDHTEQGPVVDPFTLPYRTVFCLHSLLEQVEEFAVGQDAARAFVAKEILRQVDLQPELAYPFDSVEDLAPYTETLDLLRLLMTPAALEEEMLFKISLPFQLRAVQASPAMQALVNVEDARYTFDEQGHTIYATNLAMAGCMILRECYGVDIHIEQQAMLNVPDPKTGLKKYYRPVMEDRYVSIVIRGEKPKLSRSDIERLLSNIYDTELWLELLPPEQFEFHGFMFGQLIDVTREESMSRLKHRLISRDAVLDIERARKLADLVRIHFELPELQLGLTAIDYPAEYRVPHKYKIHFHLLFEECPDMLEVPDFSGSIYHRALEGKQISLIEDLQSLAGKDQMADRLLKLGFKSLLLAPLLSPDNRVIGLVELASPRAFAINAFVKIQFREVINLFRTAVARAREEVDNRIEAVLREQFTNLHPSVEWRFMQEAFRILEAREAGEEVMSEKISFKGVYPLFGQADIVGSGVMRNRAVYEDMRENLLAAQEFLTLALKQFAFPLIDRILIQIENRLQIGLKQFSNKHETSTAELLVTEINPIIKQLGHDHQSLQAAAEKYSDLLDGEQGLVTHRRTDYELSLKRLNRELSNFFDKRDAELQQSLTHYFEKYRTDGIQYEIFAGQALLQKEQFSQIHLRNMRLAQLIDICEATRLVERVSQELPVPLQTAQLIFAYTSPLDIRFRMDEKRFDVEGAYDLRYEILKKRIDKATVNQGQERLTLPGKVAIVYLHEKDRTEYLNYIAYLIERGDIKGEVEELDLDPLQSVQGLKALRFEVNH
ncbi:MAG: hypothetical protein AAF544_01180 [Bacteroidota bacterium]